LNHASADVQHQLQRLFDFRHAMRRQSAGGDRFAGSMIQESGGIQGADLETEEGCIFEKSACFCRENPK
jgi:hypothetical protein